MVLFKCVTYTVNIIKKQIPYLTDTEAKFRGRLTCFITNLWELQWKKIIACPYWHLTSVQGDNFSTEYSPDRGPGLL